ncbi:hypothetical protein [Vibrio sp. 10N.261.51.F12]|uniref:hypothetical protein n=1 Tax=Vibrio sp. 10N.261.51.F12 TaxID=3229679 RepID=UPI00354D0053
MKNWRNLSRFIAIWALCFSYPTLVHSAVERGDEQDVMIRSWLSSDNTTTPTSINEVVFMYIEVATSRWFTAGTQISNINVPNLIIPQGDLAATNFNRRKGGESWSHQRWQIPIYPHKSGRYTIPAVDVKVQFSAQNGEDVRTTFRTRPLYFTAQMPVADFAQNQSTLVASRADLKQVWRQSDDTLSVGDSITRTVYLHADNSLAMLLPTLLPTPWTDSADYYDKPIFLNDSRVRTHYLSERQEERNYVIQKGGPLTLAPIEITFWNTDTQKLEHLYLEGATFQVRHTFSSWIKAYWVYVIAIVLVGGLAAAGVRGVRDYYRTHPLPPLIAFVLSLKRKQWSLARKLIYQRLRHKTDLVELKRLSSDPQWQNMSAHIQSNMVFSRLRACLCWRRLSNNQSQKPEHKHVVRK